MSKYPLSISILIPEMSNAFSSLFWIYLKKIEMFPSVMLLLCYPVLLMMISDYFPIFPLFILGDKEVLLLSFYRRVTHLHRAKEICFRFHQKFARTEDFESSSTCFPSASVASESLSLGALSKHEGSVVLLQSFLIAQPPLHPAPFIQFSTINPSLSCSLDHKNFYNITV